MLIKGDDIKLFLTDLCGRIYYRPKGVLLRTAFDDEEIEVIGYDGHFIDFFRKGDYDQASIDRVRLYLRPMRSMTEEEKKEYESFFSIGEYSCGGSLYGTEYEYIADSPDDISQSICLFDWLNAHHFDYRRLIEDGLALEAPEGMYRIDIENNK